MRAVMLGGTRFTGRRIATDLVAGPLAPRQPARRPGDDFTAGDRALAAAF